MKAEMGQKLSKRQGYPPIQTAEKRDCGGLGHRREKNPAEAPGLEVRQYGGKAVGQLIQSRVIMPGVPPADKSGRLPIRFTDDTGSDRSRSARGGAAPC